MDREDSCMEIITFQLSQGYIDLSCPIYDEELELLNKIVFEYCKNNNVQMNEEFENEMVKNNGKKE